jgi:tRNA(Ile)-lysidine synthase
MSVEYIVAVSGGVDSVVLLDMLVHGRLPTPNSQLLNADLIVAHFDHGIRQESAEDALFVKHLAGKYGLPYEARREELGVDASEQLARDRRYIFLREIAKKYHAKIMTAHHLDDLVETIAINALRGTGWRGLAVLDSRDIERPLLDMTKAALIEYATEHELAWREDVTNQNIRYLRNDIRQRLNDLDGSIKQLLKRYRDRQVFLRKEIDNESDRLIGASPYRRNMFIMVSDKAAMELLRAVFIKEYGWAPTRPQLGRALMAIKTIQAGKSYDVTAGVQLQFSRTHFVVEHL